MTVPSKLQALLPSCIKPSTSILSSPIPPPPSSPILNPISSSTSIPSLSLKDKLPEDRHPEKQDGRPPWTVAANLVSPEEKSEPVLRYKPKSSISPTSTFPGLSIPSLVDTEVHQRDDLPGGGLVVPSDPYKGFAHSVHGHKPREVVLPERPAPLPRHPHNAPRHVPQPTGTGDPSTMVDKRGGGGGMVGVLPPSGSGEVQMVPSAGIPGIKGGMGNETLVLPNGSQVPYGPNPAWSGLAGADGHGGDGGMSGDGMTSSDSLPGDGIGTVTAVEQFLPYRPTVDEPWLTSRF
ncbi:hypothetical protein TREMEDRAFT_59882 [Tremella mesenterica DSM 1558]|uniref:uncharacterized protein n=1 Tax=Tremella mesenterica (strain ATCC 24925 / CBS 8224 / DSM 1558 / NBRC 9311 / NRRL Y-6157 / RJB 2259-6 / UBC 559-6) TaxID=578456 RepID=UPI0003F49583|nr:uncharacterized protein TREMEDRAFT_59882 [Tremella mesenterica DSM 1558]EIW73709.1 hypothetical protein TREMEDRAFT_59882 [Tremella mesenterica DSM 1558]